MRAYRTWAAILTATLLAPPAALAQQPNGSSHVSSNGSNASDENLPVSLDRIRRELKAQPPIKETKDGIRLQYYVEVYGHAPQIQLFTPDDNLGSSAVKYGGMTHQEFLNLITPEEFRSPPADIGSAIAALIKWATEKKKNSSTNK